MVVKSEGFEDEIYFLGGKEPFYKVKVAWCKQGAIETWEVDLWLGDDDLADEDGETPSSLDLKNSGPIVVVAVVNARGRQLPPSDERAASPSTTVCRQSSCSTSEAPYDEWSPVTGPDDTPCEMTGKRRRTGTRYSSASVQS